jgi:hypothetical protein
MTSTPQKYEGSTVRMPRNIFRDLDMGFYFCKIIDLPIIFNLFYAFPIAPKAIGETNLKTIFYGIIISILVGSRTAAFYFQRTGYR